MKNVINKIAIIFSLMLITSSICAISYVNSIVYPQYAIDNCIEGYVILEFDLKFSSAADSIVLPTNIKVAESSPEGVFEKSAINAVKKWQYSLNKSKSLIISKNGLFLQKVNFELGSSECVTANKALNKDATTVAPIS